MALGGGTFNAQNKTLPGTYINFISVAKASSALHSRGIATMPLELDWGVDDEVFEVSNEEFQKNSLKIFGYEYTNEKLKGLRDLFLNAKVLYVYRLNSGNKAENSLATAKYTGVRGNDLKIVISQNVDDSAKYDVSTYLDVNEIDKQTVSSSEDLQDNDFLVWKNQINLQLSAGIPLTGGSNGDVFNAKHQNYLDKIESYTFNTMGVPTTNDTLKQLYVNFTKRMREEIGAKFQTVMYNFEADYEGVINVKNKCLDSGDDEAKLVYFVTGLQAGCEVNKSCLNRKYDGEYIIDCEYTQAQLVTAINAGEFMLHKVGDDVRVLSDINSLVTVTSDKGEVFKENQTIRVIDQIANDIALIFNSKYLGVIPNDESGRINLWTDIVKHHEELQKMRAIENFSDSDVTVSAGDTKKAVIVNDFITVVNSMAQVYMTVKVA